METVGNLNLSKMSIVYYFTRYHNFKAIRHSLVLHHESPLHVRKQNMQTDCFMKIINFTNLHTTSDVPNKIQTTS